MFFLLYVKIFFLLNLLDNFCF